MNFNDKIPVQPHKCLCIHALDGYETYKIDNNTIGVRPIWFDVNHDLPKKAGMYWVAYEINGRLKSHYCIWEEKSRKYQGSKWGWRSREYVRRENIKFWMEIPKPPCQADEKKTDFLHAFECECQECLDKWKKLDEQDNKS